MRYDADVAGAIHTSLNSASLPLTSDLLDFGPIY
jgi:hypothetical protein